MPLPPRLKVLSDADLQGPAIAVVQAWNMNLHRTIAHSPAMLGQWLPWAEQVLRHNSLPEREREIVILRVAVAWRSDYEWSLHRNLALSIGMTEADLQGVARGAEDPHWTAFEAALLRSTDEVLDRLPISDANWAILETRYSPEQLVDLMMTIGEFSLVAMMLTTFRIPLEDRPGLEFLAPYLQDA
jgi:alkylhydroperoxidase family enzyme